MKLSPQTIAVMLAILAGGFGIFWFSGASGGVASRTIATSTVDVAAAIAQPGPPPPGYIRYENTVYGFSFYHSPQAKITEYDEGKGAMTVTLENVGKVRGLQVFIVPYSEPTISEARFKEDVPSGIRTDVENTSVAGIPAVTFKSRDDSLGDTREIWFIHGGFLYEITTFTGVGDWLAPIVATWKFE